MRISVKLQLNFADHAPEGKNPFELELDPKTRVSEVLDSLGLTDSTPKVIVLNGRKAEASQWLSPGDELIVFPPLEGG